MASVTQSIPSLLGGVSKQPDDKKLPGQVREAINSFPDPTFGLTKRPGTEWLATISSTPNQFNNAKWFYINRSLTERYIGCFYGSSIKIWNVANPSATVTVTNSGSSYLNYGSSTADASLQVLSVQDTTIVVNNAKTVTAKATPAPFGNKNATLKLLSVEYGSEYKVTINSFTTSFTTRNADNGTWDHTTTNKFLNLQEVLDTLFTNIQTLNTSNSLGLTVTKLQGSIEISGSSSFTISASGGLSTTALQVNQTTFKNISELPAQSIHGRTARIDSTTGKEDVYWVKFVAENGVSGRGIWEETVDPNVSPGLDASTMPHRLSNPSLNTFVFEPIPWEDRLVGDDDTNTHPSFVGKSIERAFFHNNRLGFLTEDNVSLSQSGEFFNFYHASALTQVSSDPIDINCSSLRPAVLHSVIPAAQGLILFSRQEQFLLYSDDGILTPTTATIRTISNYDNDKLVIPTDVGSSIVFTSKSPGYTRIFAMITRGQQENPDVQDIGRIVSEWIPDTVTQLVASPQTSYFALYGPSSEYAYFFRNYVVGEDTVMQAWFNWKLPGQIQFMVPDNDDVFIVTYSNGRYSLLQTNLTQSPSTPILRTDEGQVVQLCLDMYANPSSIVYDATSKVSKCYLPYSDISTLNPAIVIADPLNTGQSGFFLTPERGSDGGGAYLIVPGENLTGQTSKVYLGYKYEFDVYLPKIFYRPSENLTDYTANLTIARIKVSVGLSSNVGFKLKAANMNEWYDIQLAQKADYYLSDDVPLANETVYTLPIHQKNTNYTLRIYSDSPFPLSLTSMTWEGNYSPRFYRRA
jgi:hypothetical protein